MTKATAVALLGTVTVSLVGCAKLDAPTNVAVPFEAHRPVASTVPAPLKPRPVHRASRSRVEPAPMDNDNAGIPTLLLRIRSCESGPNGYATHGYAFDANYIETNPASTASGAWQFLDSTWQSTTGLPGRAKDYSPAVQDAAALKLYAAEGSTPWAASRPCWGA
jgi:hypothetical protein